MNQASCVIDSGGLEKIFGFDKIKIQKNSWQHHMINNEKMVIFNIFQNTFKTILRIQSNNK